MAKSKPDCVREEHLKYLDDLRVSGRTNMFGAAPYLQDEFGLSKRESHEVLAYWMETFEERHRDEDTEYYEEEGCSDCDGNCPICDMCD